jgi:RNA polymerase sigma-70 factor, ECF subfamily
LAQDIHIILEGCKRGERLMQKQLYELCYSDMLKVCLRYTKDQDKAALVLNDSMLKVFKNIGTYTEEGKLLGWVKRIVVNTCIDYVRVKANMQPDTIHESHIADDYAIDESLLHKMDAQAIRQLIHSLPEKQAIVFNLYVYEEYDHNEIATLLQIPAGTSRYYLSEARKALKKKVQNNIFSLNKAI